MPTPLIYNHMFITPSTKLKNKQWLIAANSHEPSKLLVYYKKKDKLHSLVHHIEKSPLVVSEVINLIKELNTRSSLDFKFNMEKCVVPEEEFHQDYQNIDFTTIYNAVNPEQRQIPTLKGQLPDVINDELKPQKTNPHQPTSQKSNKPIKVDAPTESVDAKDIFHPTKECDIKTLQQHLKYDKTFLIYTLDEKYFVMKCTKQGERDTSYSEDIINLLAQPANQVGFVKASEIKALYDLINPIRNTPNNITKNQINEFETKALEILTNPDYVIKKGNKKTDLITAAKTIFEDKSLLKKIHTKLMQFIDFIFGGAVVKNVANKGQNSFFNPNKDTEDAVKKINHMELK